VSCCTISCCIDFHPRILGLTGTQEQIDSVTKLYRIYHSKSAKDSDNDYLVMTNRKCANIHHGVNCQFEYLITMLEYALVIMVFSIFISCVLEVSHLS